MNKLNARVYYPMRGHYHRALLGNFCGTEERLFTYKKYCWASWQGLLAFGLCKQRLLNYVYLFRGQNCRPEQTPYHSQHALSKEDGTGSWQYQATVSYFHWSGPLQHCESHPCLCLDCSQDPEHARTCPAALLLSKKWSGLEAVFPISIRCDSHSATSPASLVSNNTKPQSKKITELGKQYRIKANL